MFSTSWPGSQTPHFCEVGKKLDLFLIYSSKLSTCNPLSIYLILVVPLSSVHTVGFQRRKLIWLLKIRLASLRTRQWTSQPAVESPALAHTATPCGVSASLPNLFAAMTLPFHSQSHFPSLPRPAGRLSLKIHEPKGSNITSGPDMATPSCRHRSKESERW